MASAAARMMKMMTADTAGIGQLSTIDRRKSEIKSCISGSVPNFRVVNHGTNGKFLDTSLNGSAAKAAA